MVPILPCPGLNLIFIIAHLLYGQSSLAYSNLCEERVVTVYLIAFSEPNMVPGMHCTHNKIFVE